MRLDQLHQYGVRKAAPEVRVEALESDARPNALERLLPGEVIACDGGTCFVVPTDYHLSHRHGIHPLDRLSGVLANQLALISHDSELAYLDMSRAVFLDTETTGLGLGAGTYVFLVGAGFIEGERFRVKQFFLHGPHHETAFLSALSDFLGRFSAIITFNGKAFDWPLLENRFVLHRRDPPLDDPAHVDLLHPSRRLWKRRLESCALSSLEQHVLGFSRTEEDVPGWQIPSLYFQYLHTGNAQAMRRVFYHNLHDILSLASLAIHIDRVLSDPHGGLVAHGLDFMSLGRAYERAGRVDAAIECYEEALRRDLSCQDHRDCLLWLASLQKRSQMGEEAKQTWYLLRDHGGLHALIALVELAKHHEHVERDDEQALEDVEHALRLADLYQCSWPGSDTPSLERRRLRLVNRYLGGTTQRHGRGQDRDRNRRSLRRQLARSE